MFTFVNEQIDNISFENDLNARIDKLTAETGSQFTSLSNSISNAISTADRAMTQALARI